MHIEMVKRKSNLWGKLLLARNTQSLELPLPYSMSIYCGRLLVFRIYVDLPDAENRVKILRIFLAQENLEPEFHFEKLAEATEGYSGSDLKVKSLNI